MNLQTTVFESLVPRIPIFLKGTIKEMRDSYKNAEHLNDAQTLS
jgi:hypothetical protein